MFQTTNHCVFFLQFEAFCDLLVVASALVLVKLMQTHWDSAMSKPLIVIHVATYHPLTPLIQSGSMLKFCVSSNTPIFGCIEENSQLCWFKLSWHSIFNDFPMIFQWFLLSCLLPKPTPPIPSAPWIWLGRGGTEAAVAWRFPWPSVHIWSIATVYSQHYYG